MKRNFEILAEAERQMRAASKVLDLGSGNNPYHLATHAVDKFIEPEQRTLGDGERIDEKTFERKGITFAQADIEDTPFADKEFDFAISSHVFEHVVDPARACQEMMRVAKAGLIVTPFIFTDVMFGRPYHNWFVFTSNDGIHFLEKSPPLDRPFGAGPNIFDRILNQGNWNNENLCPQLSVQLNSMWNSRSEVVEVAFIWEGSFDFHVHRTN